MTTRLQLFKELAVSELRKHLPVRPEWFSEQALTTGTLSRVVSAVADQVASLRDAATLTREGLVLRKAQGAFLDAWGLDLDLPRETGETDEAYRTRLLAILGQDHTTEVGLRAHIENSTGLETTLIIPWKNQAWYGKRQPGSVGKDAIFGLSGKAQYSSPYVRAFVVDVMTRGYSPKTEPTAASSAAAGVKLFFSTLRDYRVDSVSISSMVELNSDRIYEYWLRRHEYFIFSGETPWGGGKIAFYDRYATKDFGEVDCWNRLDLRCQIAFDSFRGVTWREAVIGPIQVHPNANILVQAD